MVSLYGDGAAGLGLVAADREEGAMARFEQRKTQKMEAISCGADKSKKGSFDAPIEDMLEHLNLHGDYVSTSSCSGRVAIFWENTAHVLSPSDPVVASGENSSADGDSRRHKKGGTGGQWLLCEHGPVTVEDVLEALARAPKAPGVATFKHEPFILHVECRSLDAAARLMEVARNGGFRESGISIGKKHVMVGVRTSSLKIEAPVLEDGCLLVNQRYLGVLVRLANDKFAKNRQRTDKLYALLRRSLLAAIQPPSGIPADGTSHLVSNGQTPPVEQQGASADAAGGGGGEGQLAAVCGSEECEHVRGLVVKAGLLNKTLRNTRRPDGRMAIPLLPRASALLRMTERRGHGGAADKETASPTAAEVEVRAAPDELVQSIRTGRVTVEMVEHMAAAGKSGGKAKLSPHQRLMHALQQLLEDAGAAAGGGGELGGRKQRDKSRIELEGAVPRKWEEYSDMIVLPEGSLQSSLWEGIDRKALWRTAAEALGVARLAVKGEVDKGRMRSSHVNLVHPPEADGWVSVTQNGITYTFDVTRVMFSRGNVNERRRMGAVNARGETVVDLYAGIGYFTVPLLAQAGAAHLYACELNPDSVEALRRNLRGNAVDDRCTVLPGDNAVTAPKLKGLADRVNLGLLPSSELGWGLAMGALKDDAGGWLHVHENVSEADEAAWLVRLQDELCRLAKECGKKGSWKCLVRHVEHVKTFAPRVWHVVADVECRPCE